MAKGKSAFIINLNMKILKLIWAILGVIVISVFLIAEPWSTQYLSLQLQVVTAFIKALLLVETVGYFYHRFLEHLGIFTQTTKQVRKNQRNHWRHHMIDYPIGVRYRRKEKYQKSQKGIPWEWVFPFVATFGLLIYLYGFTIPNITMMLSALVYGFIVGKTHARFHEIGNPWENNKYFQYLERVHKLHHWNQETNFGITSPIIDMLFGTYMPPKKHKMELATANEDLELYESDIINYNYLLHHTKNLKQAIYIGSLKTNKEGVNKLKIINANRHDKNITQILELVTQ